MDNVVKSATRWMLLIIAGMLLLWAVYPEWRTVSLGLTAGLAVSTMNAFLLKRRVELLAEIAVQEGTQTKKRGVGFGSRAAMVLLAAMFAYKYPDVLNLPATLVGSMVYPLLFLVVAFIENVKQNNSGKG